MNQAARSQPPNFNAAALKRSLRRPRTFLDRLLTLVVGGMALLALCPLLSVLWMLVARGGSQLSVALFTELPPPPAAPGEVLANPGGVGNCAVGTLVMVGIAGCIAVPFGVLASVFLAEFGQGSRAASAARFSAKTLTGFPSILAGVFAFAMVVTTIGYSAVAGGVALSVLMIPTVLLTSEEAIKMVPQPMKAAAIGMGATDTQVMWRVTLPTAFPAILTGVMLAVARAAGETAPLLFTAMFSDYWFKWTAPGLRERTASLSVLIYDFATSAYDNHKQMAWAAALVLVGGVLALNVAAQILGRRSHRHA